MTTSKLDIKPPVFLYADLTEKIINVAFTVHNVLGPGFSEIIYEQAFVSELIERGMPLKNRK